MNISRCSRLVVEKEGRKVKMAAAAAVALELPPGFRFHPTDEELVIHYLCRKCASQPIAVPIIAEIDLYKYNPWHLPGKFFSTFSNLRGL